MPATAGIWHSNLIPRFLLSAGGAESRRSAPGHSSSYCASGQAIARCLLFDRTRRSAHRVATAEEGREASIVADGYRPQADFRQ